VVLPAPPFWVEKATNLGSVIEFNLDLDVVVGA